MDPIELPLRPITSRDNPTYKQIRMIRHSRSARKAGRILIEGFRQVEDALRSGIIPEIVLVTPQARQHDRWPGLSVLLESLGQAAALDGILLDARLFAELAATESPQGIALVALSPIITTPDTAPSARGLYLVLEGIQDPGNLGTMIRTADAFNFDGVVLAGPTADPFGDKTLRAAMGSVFHLPILTFPDIRAASNWLKLAQIPLLAADLAGEPFGRDTHLAPPAALMIGNEGSGLTQQARELADIRLKISMPGRAESLNAAAATAILCHALALGRPDG